MEDKDTIDKDGDKAKLDQPLKHSLPGTNQAGKGPGSSAKNGHLHRPRDADAQPQDQLEEHSLPGTNQAGKGPGSTEKKD